MDIEEDNDIPLIFGLAFMKTAQMMLDVNEWIMKVGVQDEEVSFNLVKALQNSKENGFFFNMDAVDEIIMDVQKHPQKQALNVINTKEKTRIEDEECLNEQGAPKEAHILRYK